jgi:hypothetical protein
MYYIVSTHTTLVMLERSNMFKNILFMISLFCAFGEPIIMPIMGLIGMYICYLIDDGTMFYK